jgi:hypothetical protein
MPGLEEPRLLEGAVPKTVEDALARELVSLIPIVGDALLVYEAINALREGKTLVALIYLLNALPGPTLPLTHLLVMGVEK